MPAAAGRAQTTQRLLLRLRRHLSPGPAAADQEAVVAAAALAEGQLVAEAGWRPRKLNFSMAALEAR